MPKYAQTDILTGEGKIKAGEVVSESTKGLSKDDFKQLVDSGAVGDDKPEEIAPTGQTIGASATVDELDEANAANEATKTRSGS